MNKTLLALDIATHTGWAEGDLGGVPKSGSIRFANVGDHRANTFAGAIQWLGTRLQAFRPHIIAYEKPFTPDVMRGHTNRNTALILLGLPAVIQGVAYRMGVHSLCGCAPNTIRKYFLGFKPERGANIKKLVMARCRELGHDVKNDNEADAIALWYYVDAMLSTGLSLEAINEDR